VLRPAGRTLARVAVIGRDGTERWCEINAATGAITGSFGLTGAPTLLPLADGAVRLAMVAPVGTGGADPVLRVQLLQGAGVTSYAGTPGLGLAVSEVNARLATGADLYLPTDAAGRARGVAGGAAWAWVPVWTGGVFKPQETRLERMYSLEILPGLHARVSAPLEVRHA
jgi:hypothetical protein